MLLKVENDKKLQISVSCKLKAHDLI